MTLSIDPNDALPAAASPAPVADTGVAPLGRILVVEDDEVEARRLVSALANLGYESQVAGDGDAALARLQGEAWDAVLLDLVLPGLDGMGVLGAMARRGIATPVVAAVTPQGLDGAASAIKAGAKDFVVKPAGALRLKVALANAIALGAPKAPALDTAPRAVDSPRLDDFPADHPEAEHLSLLDSFGHARPLSAIEAEVIRFALSLYGGHMSEAARRLGIGRSTLYRKLEPLDAPVMELSTQLAVAAE